MQFPMELIMNSVIMSFSSFRMKSTLTKQSCRPKERRGCKIGRGLAKRGGNYLLIDLEAEKCISGLKGKLAISETNPTMAGNFPEIQRPPLPRTIIPYTRRDSISHAIKLAQF